MKSFTTLKNLFGSLSQNSSADNLTLGGQLINDAHRYLLQKYFDNERTETTLTVASQQAYIIPANISKPKNVTVTVGQLKFTPKEVKTINDWTNINTLPYVSDIPNYYYVYNNEIQIFPIPATAGNTITYNYKTRVVDMNFTDYTTGTIGTATVASTAIVGSGTAWTTTVFPVANVLPFNLYLTMTPPKGDGLPYRIASFADTTHLTLESPVIQVPGSGASYVIGQMPLLSEDFHDMLVYYALMTYYSSILDNQPKHQKFKDMYDEKLELLQEYAGTKSINVDLGDKPQQVNPNLFLYSTP